MMDAAQTTAFVERVRRQRTSNGNTPAIASPDLYHILDGLLSDRRESPPRDKRSRPGTSARGGAQETAVAAVGATEISTQWPVAS